jgi:outer membrane protein OmpA-like peptidoglycan-associated protein
MSSSRWLQASLLGATLIVGGCVVDQHSDTQGASRTAKDASSNTKPGAAPGALAPDNKERSQTPASSVPGAVPSAPVAGGVGYYQDHQERLLSERLSGTAVRVVRNADTIKLIVPGNIAFALNSEQLQPNFIATLDNVAQVLKEYSKTVIDIKGYTDSTGSFEHNQQLSERRAQSVGNYLMTRQIAATRIRSAGFGPRNPLFGNDTESGRNQNRRVEIELVPMP